MVFIEPRKKEATPRDSDPNEDPACWQAEGLYGTSLSRKRGFPFMLP